MEVVNKMALEVVDPRSDPEMNPNITRELRENTIIRQYDMQECIKCGLAVFGRIKHSMPKTQI